MLRFTAPAEVKGVALLVVNHPDRASDQWMWTPAIQRDRRVALQDRSQRFFGTDFSFEDLEERDVDQYDFSMDGEETLNGAPCWRIIATPRKTKTSQYTQSRVWIRKDNYAYQQVESFIKARGRPAAEVQRHPERAGHLDRPDAGDDRPAAEEPHGPAARGPEVQRAAARTTTSRCRRSAGNDDDAPRRRPSVPARARSSLPRWPSAGGRRRRVRRSTPRLSQRGFLEGTGIFYPQTAPPDDRAVDRRRGCSGRRRPGARPAWLTLSGAFDARAATDDRVERSWSIDWERPRPAAAGAERPRPERDVRRAAA